MNELSIELYKQALKKAYETIGAEHADTSFFQGTVSGMFGKSLIEECASIDFRHVSEGEFTHDQCHLIGKIIKEHFGVK
jgi:hypothetical protein